jgi:hypothetical protein
MKPSVYRIGGSDSKKHNIESIEVKISPEGRMAIYVRAEPPSRHISLWLSKKDTVAVLRGLAD